MVEMLISPSCQRDLTRSQMQVFFQRDLLFNGAASMLRGARSACEPDEGDVFGSSLTKTNVVAPSPRFHPSGQKFS